MLDFMGVSLETQRVGDNRPAMNASFPAGNNGSDVRDGTRATRKFPCGESLRAARSLAIIYCDEMRVNVARVVWRTAASKIAAMRLSVFIPAITSLVCFAAASAERLPGARPMLKTRGPVSA